MAAMEEMELYGVVPTPPKRSHFNEPTNIQFSLQTIMPYVYLQYTKRTHNT